MACVCSCGKPIDCGETKCFYCQGVLGCNGLEEKDYEAPTDDDDCVAPL